jgi:hypothetical protein
MKKKIVFICKSKQEKCMFVLLKLLLVILGSPVFFVSRFKCILRCIITGQKYDCLCPSWDATIFSTLNWFVSEFLLAVCCILLCLSS